MAAKGLSFGNQRKAAVHKAIESLNVEGLFSLINAACCSPTASHRLPSLALVFADAVSHPVNGIGPVSGVLLEDLLSAARTEEPSLASLEDFVPPDPRKRVCARWGNNLYRLIPASLERPVATIERARMVSGLVDRTLLQHMGFGLSDLVELVLRYVDGVLAQLAPMWHKGPPKYSGKKATVTQREIRAADRLPDLAEIVEICTNPAQARKALKWATATAKGVELDFRNSDSFFGTTVAVRDRHGKLRALPAPFCLESLNYAVTVLAEKAAALDGSLCEQFATLADRRVADLLTKTQKPIIGPISGDGIGRFHSLVPFAGRSLLAVDVIGDLNLSKGKTLGQHCRMLSKVLPGTQLRTGTKEMTIPDDANIARLVVIASSAHVMAPQDEAVTVMSMDELDWIVSSGGDSDDLFLFCDELAKMAGKIHKMVAFETINVFEHWRHNGKSIGRFGVPIGMILFQVHRGDAEWYQAAERYPLEQALLALGMPRSAEWDSVECTKKEARVARLGRNPEGWLITYPQKAVGIRVLNSRTPKRHWRLSAAMATAVVWRLRYAYEAFTPLLTAAVGDTGALRIILDYSEDNDKAHKPIRLAYSRAGEIDVVWTQGCYELGLSDAAQVEGLLGVSIAQGLASLASTDVSQLAAAFLEQWTAAPPGLSMDVKSMPQANAALPAATLGNAAFRSQFLRDLAEKLYSNGTKTGLYRDKEAKELESSVVYPILYDLFHQEIASLDSSALLLLSVTQVELAYAERFRREQELTWKRGFPVVDFDPTQVETKNRHEGLRATRSLALIVEEVLRSPPSGAKKPDRLDWAKIVSIAELLLESGLRSETLHYGLQNVCIEIDSSYEVTVVEDDVPPQVDMAAFQKAHVLATMPDIAAKTVAEDPSNAEIAESILSVLPRLSPIDVALRSTRGFGLDALFGLLRSLQSWSVSPETPVAEVKLSDLLTSIKAESPNFVDCELSKAVEALTIRGCDLGGPMLEHWEQERRSIRLLTHPLVAVGDAVIVAPWLAGATLRIFAQYLSDGRLPWPNNDLEMPLLQALEIYRKTRNYELELDVVDGLRRAGLTVIPRAKKPRVLNIQPDRWVGEIDAIAVDVANLVIWVVEVKDPYLPFSPAQIKALISDFHGPTGYVGKLLLKTNLISENVTNVLSAAKCESGSSCWRVRPLMVTRRPIPAAFARECDVPFITLEELGTMAKNPELLELRTTR